MKPNEKLSGLATDKEGYLINLSDWSEAVCVHLAKAESLKLTDKH